MCDNTNLDLIKASEVQFPPDSARTTTCDFTDDLFVSSLMFWKRKFVTESLVILCFYVILHMSFTF